MTTWLNNPVFVDSESDPVEVLIAIDGNDHAALLQAAQAPPNTQGWEFEHDMDLAGGKDNPFVAMTVTITTPAETTAISVMFSDWLSEAVQAVSDGARIVLVEGEAVGAELKIKPGSNLRIDTGPLEDAADRMSLLLTAREALEAPKDEEQ